MSRVGNTGMGGGSNITVSALSTGRTERPNIDKIRTERKQHRSKKPVSDPRRFRNGRCSARDLCPEHRRVAMRHRFLKRAIMERLGHKPYSFDDERANELIALAQDLYGPTLSETPEAREQVFVIANYLTGEPNRFKAWLAEAAPWYDDADELLERLKRKRRPYRFSSAKLAAMFDVTWERKKRLGLKTIAACTGDDKTATRSTERAALPSLPKGWPYCARHIMHRRAHRKGEGGLPHRPTLRSQPSRGNSIGGE
jgi:hypothetical protein